MKAAIHKYRKGGPSDNNAAVMSDDDLPLSSVAEIKKASGTLNGKVNGTNGHNGAGQDAMQVDEKPLVSRCCMRW